MRFPEKAARRSAESRGQGSLVPAPAGHIAPGRHSCCGRLLCSAASARRPAERRGRRLPAARLRAARSPRRSGRAPWRTPAPRGEPPYGPRGPVASPSCRSGRPGLRAAAGGRGRSARRRRLRAQRPFARGRARAGGWARGHVPRPRPPWEEGPPGGGDAGRGAPTELWKAPGVDVDPRAAQRRSDRGSERGWAWIPGSLEPRTLLGGQV